MSSRRDELARHRAELVARAQVQRAELSSRYRQMVEPIARVGAMMEFANTLRRSPLLVMGLTALLARTPWRRLAQVPKLAWRGWQVMQIARRWLR